LSAVVSVNQAKLPGLQDDALDPLSRGLKTTKDYTIKVSVS